MKRDIPQMVTEMWLAAHVDDDGESRKSDKLGDDETTISTKDRRRTERNLPANEIHKVGE